LTLKFLSTLGCTTPNSPAWKASPPSAGVTITRTLKSRERERDQRERERERERDQREIRVREKERERERERQVSECESLLMRTPITLIYLKVGQKVWHCIPAVHQTIGWTTFLGLQMGSDVQHRHHTVQHSMNILETEGIMTTTTTTTTFRGVCFFSGQRRSHIIESPSPTPSHTPSHMWAWNQGSSHLAVVFARATEIHLLLTAPTSEESSHSTASATSNSWATQKKQRQKKGTNKKERI
jgi:hypothetical protein